jgi:ubiquinone biosynthesis monooxygenase Coq6
MQVWDASNDASMQFDWTVEARRYNSMPRTVATMTENANLTKGLLESIQVSGSSDCLMSNTKVASIEMGEDDPDGLDLTNWPVVRLDSATARQPSSIAARLLVGADGLNSPVRTFAGINSYGWDYNRHGVVATLKVDIPDIIEHSGAIIAYQRFIPELGGPIAILPLPDGHASLVWSTTTANASYLKSLSKQDFVSMVNAALLLGQPDLKYMMTMNAKTAGGHEDELQWREKTLGPHNLPPVPRIIGVQEGSVASFPLRFRHATTLTGPRVALIGDAAHTIHPLAGQGLNLGLADARSLAETIAYSVEHGMDIGDSMALERFSSERFGKGLLMCGGVDALNWMYQLGTGNGIMSNVLSGARGLGMKFFDSTLAEQTGLKGRIMKVAEGS